MAENTIIERSLDTGKKEEAGTVGENITELNNRQDIS